MGSEENDRYLDVAVLGGGFAGVYCAKELGKGLVGRKVGIIAEQNHMVFQPMLPEVAGGALAPRHVVNPIRLLCRGCSVYKGEVRRIDLDRKTVEVNAGPFTPDVTIRFGHAVIALGAAVDLSRIPGMAEHAFVLQNVGDAMKLRATVIGRMEEANFAADRDERRRLLEFVVVGGGYSGVETAGQIADLLHSSARFYRHIDRDDISVLLVHSRATLLQTLNPSLGDYTRRCLEQLGVRVILERRVKAVTAKRVILDDGSAMSASTVISTVGNAPHPVIRRLCDEFDLAHERYRIRADVFCRVEGHESVWTAGDCAAIPRPDGGWCPDTAQFAQRQGTRAGQNIRAAVEGDWLKPFAFRGLGELASIGHRKAVASIMGLNFSGFIAWWMWRTIYLAKLPGLERKLRVMSEWTLDVFFPRDISLLTPEYTSGLSEMHLEPGDVLFSPGEPAFSFYVVKAGRMEIRDSHGRVVRAIEAGGHFGERALLADKVWRFTAVAAEETTLVALNEKIFSQLAATSGSIGGLLAQTAAAYKSPEEISMLLERVPSACRNRVARDVMKTDVDTIPAGATVREALDVLRDRPHSAYPVLGSEGEVAGVLRRQEFYEWLKNSAAGPEDAITDMPLSALPTVTPDTPVPDIVEALVRGGATKAVVTTESANRLAGFVSLIDLLRAEPALPDVGKRA